MSWKSVSEKKLTEPTPEIEEALGFLEETFFMTKPYKTIYPGDIKQALATLRKAVSRPSPSTLEEALKYAVGIIESYQIDIRDRGYDKEGFCQGEIYREAIPKLEAILRKAASGQTREPRKDIEPPKSVQVQEGLDPKGRHK